MRYAASILVLLGMLFGGCGRGQDAEVGPSRTPEQYGDLAGLKASPNQKLRAELARIEEDGGTPELLNRTSVPRADNVAVGLLGLFKEDKLGSIRAEAEKIFPAGRFTFNPIRLQRAINFRKKYDVQRRKARDALARPKCDFGIQFMAGCMAELKFIDVVRICIYLEAFQAAESLDDDRLDEAIESLRIMLRLASCLAAEKHFQTRVEAAYAHTNAFAVLQELVMDENVTRPHFEKLHDVVLANLKTWPSDADALIGDRALGLHAYEMIRDGALLAFLGPEEIRKFEKERILVEFIAAAERNPDRDELFYLETMRAIIDASSQPYYTREELFDQIQQELQDREDSPDYPLVAARLLLPDIEKGQLTLAQDRANWEAWALALALATRRSLPSFEHNPLTGMKYYRSELPQLISIGNVGPGDYPLVEVPNLGEEEGNGEEEEN